MSNQIEMDFELVKSELIQIKDAFKTTAAKLMVATQTVHELLKGHMDLRAALTVAQTDKTALEAYIKSLLNPQAEEAKVETAAEETSLTSNVEDKETVQEASVNNVDSDANTISA